MIAVASCSSVDFGRGLWSLLYSLFSHASTLLDQQDDFQMRKCIGRNMIVEAMLFLMPACFERTWITMNVVRWDQVVLLWWQQKKLGGLPTFPKLKRICVACLRSAQRISTDGVYFAIPLRDKKMDDYQMASRKLGY